MLLRSVGEGAAIALDSIRANKLRSALTILGVVIGVTTVMTMASMVQGIRPQIFNAIEVAGPTTFYVIRFFSQTPLNPDRLPYEVRIRPVLQRSDADAIRRVPEIALCADLGAGLPEDGVPGGTHQQVTVFGADDRYMEIQGGTLLRGRFFSRAELTGEPGHRAGERRGRSAVRPARSAGQAGQDRRALVPGHRHLQKPVEHLRAAGAGDRRRDPIRDRAGELPATTRPTACSSRSSRGAGSRWAPRMDAVTVALRRARNLRPGDPNTFDLITQDQILDVVGNFTSYFFLAMVALSSVALLVGGIGVMAIMMVSVTDRTKEIGLRKALGATRREILWQFLVEAATLTLLGGRSGSSSASLAGDASQVRR